MVARTSPLEFPRRQEEPVRLGNLELRTDECQAFVAGCRASLTVREFEILRVLAAHAHGVVSRDEIYLRVWGARMPHRDRSVDVFVRRVRRKLGTCAPGWAYIHTHFGVGYRLSPQPLIG